MSKQTRNKANNIPLACTGSSQVRRYRFWPRKGIAVPGNRAKKVACLVTVIFRRYENCKRWKCDFNNFDGFRFDLGTTIISCSYMSYGTSFSEEYEAFITFYQRQKSFTDLRMWRDSDWCFTFRYQSFCGLFYGVCYGAIHTLSSSTVMHNILSPWWTSSLRGSPRLSSASAVAQCSVVKAEYSGFQRK